MLWFGEEKQYPAWGGWCTFYFPHINREIAKKKEKKKGFEMAEVNETGDGVEEKALREPFWASKTSHRLTVGVH